jgi:hypothetical protein
MSEASEFEEGEEEETEAGEEDENDIRSPSMEADEHDEAEEGEADLGQRTGRGSAEDDEGIGQARSCASSSTGKRVPRRSRAKGGKMPFGKVVTLSMFDCKYEVVRKAAKARGLRLIASGDDRCNIFW